MEGQTEIKEESNFNWGKESISGIYVDGAKKETMRVSPKQVISSPENFMSDMSITVAICKVAQELIAYEELRNNTGRGANMTQGDKVEGTTQEDTQTSTVEVEPQPIIPLEKQLEELQRKVSLKKSYNNIITQLEIGKTKQRGDNKHYTTINIPEDDLTEDIKAAIKFAMMKKIQEIQ
jgi:hypothetical protein